ncbi:MAG: MBL fold metallo-hydrolase [Candidatus Alcyoniella australis]|nr:MBL fold metallo-hydrolase [Candidatus Alcyoniella australis]
MKISVLASGSKGNSTYIQSQGVRLLVDAGLTLKELTVRLAQCGADPADLDGVFVTHEHIDHLRGVGPLARKHNVPVFAAQPVLDRLRSQGRIPEPRRIRSGVEVNVGPLSVRPFPISHDANEPLGYVLASNGFKLGYATDLGIATKLVAHHLAGCDALVLESNHDPQMLLDGPYPPDLKARIKGRRGHLSNQQSAELLVSLLHDRLRWVFLAHLSEENNKPELALACARRSVAGLCCPELTIVAADQHRPTELIEL